MFGEESMRLLRKRWTDATELAEELYAMLQDSVPLTTKAPFTIALPPGSTAPALTLNNWGSGPSIQFLGKDNTDQGQLTADGRLLDSQGKERSGSGTTNNLLGGAASETFAGVVVGGSGSTYTMHLYADDGTTTLNEGGGPKAFTVRQLQIDPAATIPINTWALVVKRGGKYFMQAPVWLS